MRSRNFLSAPLSSLAGKLIREIREIRDSNRCKKPPAEMGPIEHYASARTITTSDEMLQQLVNLKR